MLKGFIKEKEDKKYEQQNDNKLTTINTEPTEQKLSKQLKQEQNHRNGDHMEGYQQGGRKGRMGGKVQGLRSISGRYKMVRDVKNSIGNGKAKERT